MGPLVCSGLDQVNMMHADLGSTNSAFKYCTIPGPEKKVKKVNEFRKKKQQHSK